MSEDPFAIAKYVMVYHSYTPRSHYSPIRCREAKALQQGLKDLLKNRDPWNKEVEFQRRK